MRNSNTFDEDKGVEKREKEKIFEKILLGLLEQIEKEEISGKIFLRGLKLRWKLIKNVK